MINVFTPFYYVIISFFFLSLSLVIKSTFQNNESTSKIKENEKKPTNKSNAIKIGYLYCVTLI